ncbi:hydroxymethylpyrimidine/phosphomethylpyrimidine kinase [Soonwooa buanensis]|uniref:hydroxymethylpyrimidine kinase n=1 Tax=Soonwooa buanensis TaxID=619805 RepID=A0A1T5G5W7_9FLAO|nr:hydroxymethylpyrimidine/phosphomethylpyrimidine kinase [Soonwooa buanensis]SKC03806.1 hydroxymethylpyrimidine/phosphomethylpyrimidine kinase [Soonwooa buanensis]
MYSERPFVLSIAGFDPCGGAGTLADIKTFEQHQVQGLAVMTANTLQTENHVFSVDWIAIEDVLKSIKTLLDFYPIKAVKIGIVPNSEYLKSIVEVLKMSNSKPIIVWDTVLKSSSGKTFFNENDIQNVKEILPHLDLITPNFLEFEYLKSMNILNENKKMLCNVLLKGGHRKNEEGLDTLFTENEIFDIKPKAEKVFQKHGSGCVLSSAIVANLALGKTMKQACTEAKNYMENYLNSSPNLLGHHAKF